MNRALLAALYTAGVASICILCGCAPSDAAEASARSGDPIAPLSSSLTAEEAQRIIDAGDVTVVDVRTKAEYNEAHIPGALSVPFEEIGTNKLGMLPDSHATILVYCRTGVQSKLAAGKLAAIGYTDVRDIGGIRDWSGSTESSS
ncbi:rhodanese-like domain-containing protein [Raoultibacter phocaeensis]|uniref:rhodanese-like domain-containing protein n=1 Tax=Raoultibacter phocaeensis TaxID=2479841 RepID=UPI00111A5003|nr:rhodanese-like domain-containing protein [Raoultibacter phocaeensis]